MKLKLKTTCFFKVSVVDAETMQPGIYTILDEFQSKILFPNTILNATIYHSTPNKYDLHLNDGSRGYMLLDISKDLFEIVSDKE